MTLEAEAAIPPSVVQRRHWVRSARLAFRNWRRTRPFWAGVWAMLGGALIAYVPATAFKFFLIANSSLIIGVLVGALVGVFGLLLWFAKAIRVPLGIMIILLSLASFFTSDFGGLLLGMLMGLIGGSLAIAWVPTKTTWRQRRRARQVLAAGDDDGAAALPASATAVVPDPAESLSG